MSRGHDVRFALAVLVGKIDRSDSSVPTKLALAKARHPAPDDLRDLIDRAAATHAVALARTPELADRAYLRAVADGAVELLEDGVWTRLELMHARYVNNPEVIALFELAADAFSAAVMDAVATMLAGPATRSAIQKARAGNARR